MQDSIFAELSVIIAIGAVVSIFMKVIKQPLIIGYILTGLLVGPAFLNIVKSPETIEVFSSIGIVLLLFIVGLGLNPRVVKEVGKVSIITASAQIILTTTLGFLIGSAIGLTKPESLIIGLALSFSSTIIVLKLLNDKKEQNRLNGKISIGILLVEDIAATLALIFVNAQSDGRFSLEELLFLALKGLLIAIPLFIIANKFLPKLNKIIASSQELLFLFSIGWGFGIAAIFEALGFSVEIGALFAGVALAAFPYAQEVSSRLRPLRDFFLIVFFISLGTHLSFANFNEIWFYVLVFSMLVIWFKPFVIMTIMGLLGYTKNTSFRVGEALSQISEFSLVLLVLANQKGLMREEILNIMTIVALITIAVSSYSITYSNQLYGLFERRLILFERRKTKTDNIRLSNYNIILLGFNRGGQEFVRVAKGMEKKYVVVDYDPEVIDIVERKRIPFIYGDATDPELLEELNLPHARMAISTIGDHQTNLFLARYIEQANPSAVFICAADTAHQASELYEQGAAYVMMPHYIGSEKIGSFIKRNGYNKSEFRKFREKHLQYLETHYV